MADTGYQRHISKSESGFLTNAFSAAATSQPSQAPQTTMMQKIQPGKSYSVNAVNASGLKNSVQKSNAGGQQMRQATGAMQGQVAAVKADLKQDYMAAKQEAYNEVKDVAQDQGFEMGNVNATLAPDPSAGNAATLGALAVDAVTTAGLGTLAVGTAGAAVGATQDLVAQSKKLSPKELKSLMDEAATRLQSNSSADFFGQTQNAAPVADWDQFNGEDIQELLQGSADDLPEMQELNDLEFALNQAQQIQDLNESQEAVDYDGSKIEAALERGDEQLLDTFRRADADGKITSDEFSELRNQIEADIMADDVVTVDEVFMYVGALSDISGIKVAPEDNPDISADELKLKVDVPIKPDVSFSPT